MSRVFAARNREIFMRIFRKAIAIAAIAFAIASPAALAGPPGIISAGIDSAAGVALSNDSLRLDVRVYVRRGYRTVSVERPIRACRPHCGTYRPYWFGSTTTYYYGTYPFAYPAGLYATTPVLTPTAFPFALY